MMAKHFKVLSGEKNNRLVRIQLQGDFDGTSAHELVNILHKYLSIYPKVAIDTQGLKSINAFGLKVFLIRIRQLRRPHARIVFTGRHKFNFIQE
jgi:stage II sporulation protein AA (anti-sigma F factor antagonist)